MGIRIPKPVRAVAYLGAALLALGVMGGADSCSESKNGMSDSDIATAMKQVPIGSTESYVREILGTPNNTQRSNTEGYIDDCWYYGSSSEWQLCFDNGELAPHHAMKLTSKSRY